MTEKTVWTEVPSGVIFRTDGPARLRNEAIQCLKCGAVFPFATKLDFNAEKCPECDKRN